MNFLNERYWFQWKIVFVKTLIHLKTPSPLFWVQFIEPWEGYPTAVLSLSIGMYIIYSLSTVYMHCLILVINLCICIGRLFHWGGKFCYAFYIWGREKATKQKLIVKTNSGFNQLDADQGDQLIERLRRCGASIPLLCCREDLCFSFFEISSASCYVQAQYECFVGS